MNPVDWSELERLKGQDLREASDDEIRKLSDALRLLREGERWDDVLHLYEMFSSMLLTQSLTVGRLQELRNIFEESAIEAAHALDAKELEARYLHDRGHFLHQVGRHEDAIRAFERSAHLYAEQGQTFRALQSRYMTALCHRALNRGREAREILKQVLSQVQDDVWRAHPLEVLAWLAMDDGDLQEAENLLREALALHRASDAPDKDVMIAQVQADLGEVLGLRGKFDEAERSFLESKSILERFSGQYDRLWMRTMGKYAELLSSAGRHGEALKLLHEIEKMAGPYGAYDLFWRIELALAQTYWQIGKFDLALAKLRTALGVRRRLGRSNWQLIRQQIGRWWGAFRNRLSG